MGLDQTFYATKLSQNDFFESFTSNNDTDDDTDEENVIDILSLRYNYDISEFMCNNCKLVYDKDGCGYRIFTFDTLITFVNTLIAPYDPLCAILLKTDILEADYDYVIDSYKDFVDSAYRYLKDNYTIYYHESN